MTYYHHNYIFQSLMMIEAAVHGSYWYIIKLKHSSKYMHYNYFKHIITIAKISN